MHVYVVSSLHEIFLSTLSSQLLAHFESIRLTGASSSGTALRSVQATGNVVNSGLFSPLGLAPPPIGLCIQVIASTMVAGLTLLLEHTAQKSAAEANALSVFDVLLLLDSRLLSHFIHEMAYEATIQFDFIIDKLLGNQNAVKQFAEVGASRCLSYLKNEKFNQKSLSTTELLKGLVYGLSGRGSQSFNDTTLQGVEGVFTAEALFGRSACRTPDGQFWANPDRHSYELTQMIYRSWKPRSLGSSPVASHFGWVPLDPEAMPQNGFRLTRMAEVDALEFEPLIIPPTSKFFQLVVAHKPLQQIVTEGQIESYLLKVRQYNYKGSLNDYIGGRVARFEGVLINKDLQHGRFDKSDFSGAEFQNCTLDNASFESARLIETKFTQGTTAKSINLTRALCFGMKTAGIELDGARLDVADVYLADFSHTSLHNVSSVGIINLDKAIFRSESVSEVCMTPSFQQTPKALHLNQAPNNASYWNNFFSLFEGKIKRALSQTEKDEVIKQMKQRYSANPYQLEDEVHQLCQFYGLRYLEFRGVFEPSKIQWFINVLSNIHHADGWSYENSRCSTQVQNTWLLHIYSQSHAKNVDSPIKIDLVFRNHNEKDKFVAKSIHVSPDCIPNGNTIKFNDNTYFLQKNQPNEIQLVAIQEFAKLLFGNEIGFPEGWLCQIHASNGDKTVGWWTEHRTTQAGVGLAFAKLILEALGFDMSHIAVTIPEQIPLVNGDDAMLQNILKRIASLDADAVAKAWTTVMNHYLNAYHQVFGDTACLNFWKQSIGLLGGSKDGKAQASSVGILRDELKLLQNVLKNQAFLEQSISKEKLVFLMHAELLISRERQAVLTSYYRSKILPLQYLPEKIGGGAFSTRLFIAEIKAALDDRKESDSIEGLFKTFMAALIDYRFRSIHDPVPYKNLFNRSEHFADVLQKFIENGLPSILEKASPLALHDLKCHLAKAIDINIDRVTTQAQRYYLIKDVSIFLELLCSHSPHASRDDLVIAMAERLLPVVTNHIDDPELRSEFKIDGSMYLIKVIDGMHQVDEKLIDEFLTKRISEVMATYEKLYLIFSANSTLASSHGNYWLSGFTKRLLGNIKKYETSKNVKYFYSSIKAILLYRLKTISSTSNPLFDASGMLGDSLKKLLLHGLPNHLEGTSGKLLAIYRVKLFATLKRIENRVLNDQKKFGNRMVWLTFMGDFSIFIDAFYPPNFDLNADASFAEYADKLVELTEQYLQEHTLTKNELSKLKATRLFAELLRNPAHHIRLQQCIFKQNDSYCIPQTSVRLLTTFSDRLQQKGIHSAAGQASGVEIGC